MYRPTQLTPIGFNACIEDNCDYVDYSTLDKDMKPDKRDLTIMQLNVHGLLNKQDDLTRLISVDRNGKIHAILLVETWLKKLNQMLKRLKYQDSNLLVPTGNANEEEVLISKKLLFRERKDLTLNIPNFESITIELKTHKENFLLSSIYRPPNTSEKKFLKQYQRFLKKFTQEEKNRLIIGLDHNLDFLKHDHHKPTKDFINLNLEHNLLPTITKPTRKTKNTATLIDNISLNYWSTNHC